jgi:hypothetical protein
VLDEFGDVNGVSDVAFYGNTLYTLIAGGGCINGVPARDSFLIPDERMATNL